jgi:hypothetical protein
MYLGADSFDYSIADQAGYISNTGTVSITVSTTNQPPVADSGSFVTAEDTPLSATLSGSDPEFTPVTYVLDTSVSNGSLNLSSTGGFIYTPNLNSNGSDSFTFHVSDGVFNSAIETVTLGITPVNDVPVATNDTATGTEDTPLVLSSLMVNDTDVDTGDTLSLSSIIAGPTSGAATLTGGVINYIPNSNFCGTDSLTYQTADQSGATSNTATVNIMITCVNDTPVAFADTFSGTEDTLALIPVLANDTDVDIGDVLSITSLTQPSTGGVVSISGTSILYTPTANYCNVVPITFTYQARDLASLTSAVTNVSLSVTCVNDAPTVSNVAYSLTGNSLTQTGLVSTLTLSGNDIDGNPLTFALVAIPTQGTGTLSST